MPPATGMLGRGIRAIGTLLLTAALSAGCAAAANRGPGEGTARAAGVVASGNTLNQKVPDVAQTTVLVDQDGRPTSLRALRGKLVVLAPFLTMCQETCPMTTANLHQAALALQQTPLRSDVVFLEVTVDPARDTLPRISAYAKLYGAAPDWTLATGDPAEIRRLWSALGVLTQKAPGHDRVHDWMTGRLVAHPYDIHHQDVVLIIDRAGRLRWITMGRPDAKGTSLPVSMRQFLNDEGRSNYAHPRAGGDTAWTARDVERALTYVHGLEGS